MRAWSAAAGRLPQRRVARLIRQPIHGPRLLFSGVSASLSIPDSPPLGAAAIGRVIFSAAPRWEGGNINHYPNRACQDFPRNLHTSGSSLFWKTLPLPLPWWAWIARFFTRSVSTEVTGHDRSRILCKAPAVSCGPAPTTRTRKLFISYYFFGHFPRASSPSEVHISPRVNMSL